MDHFHCGLEVKFADDQPAQAGEFVGYASVFGGIDSYGDRIAPGAFAQSLTDMRAAGRNLPMYFNHGAAMGADARPVGVWSQVEEDERGLKVVGRLVALDTDAGRYNLALMREGAMTGLSIGYRVPQDGATFGKGPGEPRRTLTKISLKEISVVDDPADASARVLSVKSQLRAFTTQDLRDLEAAQREAGLSRADAVKAVSGFKTWLQRDVATPDPAPRDEVAPDELRSLAERIRALTA